MTDAFALDQSYHQPNLGGTRLRRLQTTVRSWHQSFIADLRQARQDHVIRRALRGIDRRLMRDLGIDRGAC